MATVVQVVIDCAEPDKLAQFWAEALGYQVQPPPDGFASWEDFLRDAGVPEERWYAASAVVDPDGRGPRIFLQRVPEPKSVKNRVHLDLNVGGGRSVPEQARQDRVRAEVARLVTLGAQQLREVSEDGGFFVVMQDPEGNEFCLQ